MRGVQLIFIDVATKLFEKENCVHSGAE